MTPENYRIWFEYFVGRKEEIKNRLDELLASDTIFTKELNEKLYEQFFIRDLVHESAQKAQMEIETADVLSHKVSEMLINIMKDMLSGVESTSGYGEKLKKYMGHMGQASGLPEVQTLLANLLRDTQETTAQTRQMQKKLETSSEELQALQVELVNTKREARTDNLTRLWNRRFFDETMAETLASCKKGMACSLLMLDIDHFKKFNDEFGHLIGDKLLRHVAKEMKNLCPPAAQVCRYGGEEFAIVLTGANLRAAMEVAEKIRKDVEDVSFTVKGRDIDVTISIGGSEMRPDDTLKTVIERADAALYLAKRSGRNNTKSEKDITQSAQENPD